MKTSGYFEQGDWRRATLESRGVSSRAVANFFQELRDADYQLHAFMLARGGALCYAHAAAPYTLQTPHRLYSAGKSVMALCALFAMQEGKLQAQDRVIDYFSDLLPSAPEPWFTQMTMEHVLTMQTGQDEDPFPAILLDGDADLLRMFFHQPLCEPPGTRFRYNNTVPHVVCALVERAVGIPFQQYLEQRLCAPLGASYAAPIDSRGGYNPVTGTASADALMRFALLYLQEGMWEGEALLQPHWIQEAVRCHVHTQGNDTNGYGYQIWRNSFGGYRMDGGWGQFAILLPAADLAAVILSDMPDAGLALKAFERHIVPVLSDASQMEDESGQEMLANQTRLLHLAPQGVSPASLHQARYFGRDYTFAPNPYGILSLRMDGMDTQRVAITLETARTVHRAQCGLGGSWCEQAGHFLVEPENTIDNGVYGVDQDACLLSGGWRDAQTFEMKSKALGATGDYLFRLAFQDHTVRFGFPARVCHGGDYAAHWVSLESQPAALSDLERNDML